ncbi:MAG: hypothetical protein MHM6MM_007624 [Cercozoa sp. M6MM]
MTCRVWCVLALLSLAVAQEDAQSEELQAQHIAGVARDSHEVADFLRSAKFLKLRASFSPVYGDIAIGCRKAADVAEVLSQELSNTLDDVLEAEEEDELKAAVASLRVSLAVNQDINEALADALADVSGALKEHMTDMDTSTLLSDMREFIKWLRNNAVESSKELRKSMKLDARGDARLKLLRELRQSPLVTPRLVTHVLQTASTAFLMTFARIGRVLGDTAGDRMLWQKLLQDTHGPMRRHLAHLAQRLLRQHTRSGEVGGVTPIALPVLEKVLKKSKERQDEFGDVATATRLFAMDLVHQLQDVQQQLKQEERRDAVIDSAAEVISRLSVHLAFGTLDSLEPNGAEATFSASALMHDVISLAVRAL